MTRRLTAAGVATACLGLLAAFLAPHAVAASAGPGDQRVARLDAAQARTLQARLATGTSPAGTSTLELCRAHHLYCQAQVLAKAGTDAPLSADRPFGLGADDLAEAYGLRGAGGGVGTIAIVDAGAYPTIQKDLGVYRRTYGLPPCLRSTGCLTVRSYDGTAERRPATSKLGRLIEEFVGVETALDLEMASAACPRCRLLLLQTPPRDALLGSTRQMHHAVSHFATAVRTAHARGVDAVSISYGFPTDDFTTTGAVAAKMDVTGMAITASTGDFGFNGPFPPWPQVLPSVIAVGGTALTRSSSGTWREAAWAYAGSGCSDALGPPAYGQPASVSSQCHGSRASADISAVADPQTGVAVYDTYSPFFHDPFRWIVVGGTSASSPLVAGMYARAGVGDDVHGPNRLYAAPASSFHDVVVGANAPVGVCPAYGATERVCTADNGWDGPTGRGTPRGLRPFG
jgi:hypothetical protein